MRGSGGGECYLIKKVDDIGGELAAHLRVLRYVLDELSDHIFVMLLCNFQTHSEEGKKKKLKIIKSIYILPAPLPIFKGGASNFGRVSKKFRDCSGRM